MSSTQEKAPNFPRITGDQVNERCHENVIKKWLSVRIIHPILQREQIIIPKGCLVDWNLLHDMSGSSLWFRSVDRFK
jgi:hypothetical protein